MTLTLTITRKPLSNLWLIMITGAYTALGCVAFLLAMISFDQRLTGYDLAVSSVAAIVCYMIAGGSLSQLILRSTKGANT